MANSLNAVAVSQYADANGQIQKSYSTIGRAFETKTGWIVRLNALPLPSLNEKGIVETVLMLMPPREDNRAQPARATRTQNTGGYSGGGFGDDSEIPFMMEWR